MSLEEEGGGKATEKAATATTFYGFYPYNNFYMSLYKDRATRDDAVSSGDHNIGSVAPWADIVNAFASGVVRLDIKSDNEDYNQSTLRGKGTLLAYYPYADFNNMRMCTIIQGYTNGYIDTVYPAVYED